MSLTRHVTPPRILIADDDPAFLQMVQVYLESEGYEVGAALDGNRALEMGSNGEFDVLILDVHMPMHDGAEVLNLLRKRLLSHPLKVIALTGDTRWGLRDEMQHAGVDSYLVKPVSLRQLGKEVARLLTTRRTPKHGLPAVRLQ